MARKKKEPKAIIHIAIMGDTIKKIAGKYGVDPIKLAADNNIVNPNYIQPGKSIVIKE